MGRGVACSFIDCDRGQLSLLPPSIVEWLFEGHLIRFILDAVEELESMRFLRRYWQDGWGGRPTRPR